MDLNKDFPGVSMITNMACFIYSPFLFLAVLDYYLLFESLAILNICTATSDFGLRKNWCNYYFILNVIYCLILCRFIISFYSKD